MDALTACSAAVLWVKSRINASSSAVVRHSAYVAVSMNRAHAPTHAAARDVLVSAETRNATTECASAAAVRLAAAAAAAQAPGRIFDLDRNTDGAQGTATAEVHVHVCGSAPPSLAAVSVPACGMPMAGASSSEPSSPHRTVHERHVAGPRSVRPTRRPPPCSPIKRDGGTRRSARLAAKAV